jgi:flavin-dependent dehydrogenase
VLAAGTARLSSPAGTGWLAVGDAAATFDPISSQGILTALLTGQAAGRTVARALDGDRRAPLEYLELWHAIIDDYERERTRCYGAEHRFPASPFWDRRRARRAA